MRNKIKILMASAALCSLVPLNTYAYVIYMDGYSFEDDGNWDPNPPQGETILDYLLEDERNGDFDPVDGNIISEEDLSDNLIEYRELGTFIHNYNPTVINAKYSVESSKELYEYIKEDMVSWLWESRQDKRSAKDDSDSESYATYAGYEATYEAAVKSYNKIIDNLNSESTIKSFKSLEKSLTRAAQSLMVSYNTLRLSKASLEQMVKIYDALYDMAKLMYQVGMNTQADVETARINYESAEISLETMEISMDSIYENLCLMLGVDGTECKEIGEIPEADLSYLNEMDYETDSVKAVNSDSNVIARRHESSNSSITMELKEADLVEIEGEAEINFKTIYDNVIDSASSLDSAELALENANQEWNLTQSKYSLGMLSLAEYLQEELNYISDMNEYEAAKINLFSAISTYQWKLKGID